MSFIFNLKKESVDTLTHNGNYIYYKHLAVPYLDVLSSALAQYDKVACASLKFYGTFEKGHIDYVLKKIANDIHEQFYMMPLKNHSDELHIQLVSHYNEYTHKLICGVNLFLDGNNYRTEPKRTNSTLNLMDIYPVVSEAWNRIFNPVYSREMTRSRMAKINYRFMLLDKTNPFFWNYFKQLLLGAKGMFSYIVPFGNNEIIADNYTSPITCKFDDNIIEESFKTMSCYHHSFNTWHNEEGKNFLMDNTHVHKPTPLGFGHDRLDLMSENNIPQGRDYPIIKLDVFKEFDALSWIDNDDYQNTLSEPSDYFACDIIRKKSTVLIVPDHCYFNDNKRIVDQFGNDLEERYHKTGKNFLVMRRD